MKKMCASRQVTRPILPVTRTMWYQQQAFKYRVAPNK